MTDCLFLVIGEFSVEGKSVDENVARLSRLKGNDEVLTLG
jgi:hypothetical protein